MSWDEMRVSRYEVVQLLRVYMLLLSSDGVLLGF